MTTFSPGGAVAVRRGAALFGVTLALIGAVATWLTWRYFVATSEGQQIDNASFVGARIGQNVLWQAAEPVLDVVSTSFVIVVLGAATAIALLRRRWLLALQVVVLVGGANVTTQVLKHLVLEREQLADTSGAVMNSLPSGHTTVAASVATALVLVVPPAMRALVAVLAAGYASVTGVATMVGGWHRPSDAVTAITVVLVWAGLTITLTALANPEPDNRVAAQGGAETLRSGRPRASIAIGSGVLLVTGVVAGILAAIALLATRDNLATTSQLTSRQDLATAYVGGVLGIAAVAAVSYAAILIGHHYATKALAA